MDSPLLHVLVPVDVDDDSRTAQLVALHLAAGAGALVTLLAVRKSDIELKKTSQLDALENLHLVLLAPPTAKQYSPAIRSATRQQTLMRLRALRDELAMSSPDNVEIRVVCREGAAFTETQAFIDEAGVDVVVVLAPARCTSPVLRQLARDLQQRCSCHVQVVHPPRVGARPKAATCARWWKAIAARWRGLERLSPPADG